MGESAIDHDLGPIIDQAAVKNYRAIKEVGTINTHTWKSCLKQLSVFTVIVKPYILDLNSDEILVLWARWKASQARAAPLA